MTEAQPGLASLVSLTAVRELIVEHVSAARGANAAEAARALGALDADLDRLRIATLDGVPWRTLVLEGDKRDDSGAVRNG